MTIAQLGLNVAEFTQQQKAVVALFDELIAKVELLNSTKINVFASGLTEFNTSMKVTNELLGEITEKVNLLNASSVKLNVTTTASAGSTNASNSAKKAAADENQKLINLEKQLAQLQTDSAKREAELRVALKAKKKDLDDIAKAKNADIQQTKKAAADEKELNRLIAEEEANLAKEEKLRSAAKIANAKAEAKEIKAIQAEVAKADKQNARDKKESDASASKARADYLKEEKLRLAQQRANAKEEIKDLKAIEDARNEALNFKNSLRQKQENYTRTVLQEGTDTPNAKSQLADIQAMRAQKAEIESSFNEGYGLRATGKQLSESLSVLRNIAYILPGIGLAGLFDLAFQGINSATSALIGFNKETKTGAELQQFLAKTLNETNEAFANLVKNRKAFFQTPEQDKNKLSEQLEVQKDLNDNYYLQYTTKTKILQDDKKIAELELGRKTGIADMNEAYLKQFVTVDKIKEQLLILNKAQFDQLNQINSGRLDPTLRDKYEEQTNNRKKLIDETQKLYETELSYLTNYDKARQAIEDNDYQHQLKLNDDKKKLDETYLKNKEDLIIDSNSRIESNARSSDANIINALIEGAHAKAALIRSTLNSVLFDANGNVNNQTTDYEKDAARSDYSKSIEENERNLADKIQRVKDDFAKRNLSASKETLANQLNEEVKGNEEIYKNQELGLDKRLEAFDKYLASKRSLIELEFQYEKSLEHFSYKTPEEKGLTSQKRSSGISEVNSLTSKGVNEITSTYFAKRFADLKQDADLIRADASAQEQLADKLLGLNEQFEKGSIALTKYLNLRRAANYTYLTSRDNNAIKGAEDEIKNAKEIGEEVVQRQLSNNARLRIAQLDNDKEKIKEEELLQAQLLSAKEKSDVELEKAQQRLQQARAKLSEDEALAKVQYEQESQNNLTAIRFASFELAKSFADGYYQHQEELIQRNIELVNKQYDNEISAIQKSSLAAKDKVALETQLKAQKDSKDKEAEKQIRKEKHDSAVLDKELAMANIIWSTERAIAAAITIPIYGEKLALEYGIIGAIALAKAATTPVPSYFLGTKFHPGGFAEYAEVAPEIIKEPGRQPYVAEKRTIGYLPRGTQVIPTYDIPTISERKENTWAQTMYLAKIISKNNKKIINTFKPNITVDISFEVYKNKILNG